MSWNVIDISKYQTITDYDAVASAVDGVIFRAAYRGYGSSGTLVTDTSFEDNYLGFVDKTKIGYYFTSTAISEGEAIEEANYVYNLIKNKECDFPVYFVSEYSNSTHDGRSDELTKSERTAICIAFCNRIIALGYSAGVQATDTWFNNNLNLSDLTDYNLSIWVTKFTSEPTYVLSYDGWRKDYEYIVAGCSDNVYLSEFVNDVAGWNNEESDPADINNFTITVDPEEIQYDGEPKMPLIRVETLKLGIDYIVNYEDNINAGYGKAIVSGINNFTGVATKTFVITPISFEDSGVAIVCVPNTYEYTGEEIIPNYYTLPLLSEDIDYNVELSDNTEVGIATITATGKGNYTGTVSSEWYIIGKDINHYNIYLEGDSFGFTGQPITPEVIVDGELVLDEDYEVGYEDNIDAGIATAIVHGIGNYSGYKRLPFTILSSYIFGTVYIEPDTFVYNGSPCEPEVTVAGISPDDYIVTFRNNVNAGTAKAVIKGRNNITGTRIETFTIEGRPITDFEASDVEPQYYTGEEIKPEVTVSGGLKKDTDYTVRYEDNITVGTATIMVYGIINYKDYIMVTFEILETPLSMTKMSYDADTDLLTIKFNGHELDEGTDYIITDKREEETPEGIAHIFTLQGINGYSEVVTVTFIEEQQDIEEEFAPGTEFNLKDTPVYPNYCSVSTSIKKTGTYYIYKPQIINNRIRITKDPGGVGVPVRSSGWADLNDLRASGKPRVGDSYIVNGKLMRYSNDSSSYVEVENKTMFIIEISDLSYPYPYGMSETINGGRIGWASEDMLKTV